jgi:phage-related protein
VREASGAFRVIYVATFAEAVYVRYAFAKKTTRTAPRDLALAQSRFRALKRGATP